jgi:putative flippase GtrA
VPSVHATESIPAAPRSELRRGGRLPPRREVLRFLVVGGTCFAVTCAINYLLKLTVLTAKPVTALVIATVAATLLSFALNRRWTFRTRGGRALPYEAALFFGVNGIATVINAAPLWIARYLLDLRVPEVTRIAQETSDLVSGIILGTALSMGFRLWAYRTWVFPAPARPGEGTFGRNGRSGRYRHHREKPPTGPSGSGLSPLQAGRRPP